MQCGLCEGYNEKYRVIMEDNFTFVMMTIYPLTNGHLMVMPKKHITKLSDFSNLEAKSYLEMIDKTSALIKKTYQKDCLTMFNGLLGSESHIHMHVFPASDNIRTYLKAYDRKIMEKNSATIEYLTTECNKIRKEI